MGCEVKARIAIHSEQTDEYAEHYKHGDDMFYKGTFIIRETTKSVLNPKGNEDVSLRNYQVLGTDVEFQTKVIDTELYTTRYWPCEVKAFELLLSKDCNG